MKVGDLVRHVTYSWVGIIVINDVRGISVWWAGWPKVDGPMQEYWLEVINEGG